MVAPKGQPLACSTGREVRRRPEGQLCLQLQRIMTANLLANSGRLLHSNAPEPSVALLHRNTTGKPPCLPAPPAPVDPLALVKPVHLAEDALRRALAIRAALALKTARKTGWAPIGPLTAMHQTAEALAYPPGAPRVMLQRAKSRPLRGRLRQSPPHASAPMAAKLSDGRPGLPDRLPARHVLRLSAHQRPPTHPSG